MSDPAHDTGPYGAEPPSFLQSAWWLSIKAESGWSRVDGRTNSTVGALSRRIGPFTLVYLPHAFPDERSLERVVETMGTVSRGATIARWDVPWSRDRFDRMRARALGLSPSPMRIQPPDTVIIDLSPPEDALLAAMKSKTRYNVRLAEKKGVEIEVISADSTPADRVEEALTSWYEVYRATARRDRIAIHPFAYYRRVFLDAPDATAELPRREMILARHDRDLLGGIVTLGYHGVTTYLYGAGSDRKRNLMASYLVQWTAITRARSEGDRWYDMFGIPPSDDPSHPMHGLYRFKTGFGGEILRRAGAWDIAVRPAGAALYRAAERIRRWYHFSYTKRRRR
jgi:lipid II:glycine glycyltransferase (peptidoglycan interpeptide bridge formation enzyme)